MSNLRTVRVDAVQVIKTLRAEAEKMPSDQPLRALLELSAQCMTNLAQQLVAAKSEAQQTEKMLESYMQTFASKQPKRKMERYGAPEAMEYDK